MWVVFVLKKLNYTDDDNNEYDEIYMRKFSDFEQGKKYHEKGLLTFLQLFFLVLSNNYYIKMKCHPHISHTCLKTSLSNESENDIVFFFFFHYRETIRNQRHTIIIQMNRRKNWKREINWKWLNKLYYLLFLEPNYLLNIHTHNTRYEETYVIISTYFSFVILVVLILMKKV